MAATPREVAEISYKAYREGDVATLLGLLADEVEWEFVAPQHHLRYAGRRRTKPDIQQVFEHMAADEEVLLFEAREYIECGEKLVVIGEVAGRGRHDGKSYRFPWCHVFTIIDGKIVRWLGFYDTAARLL